MSTLEASLKDPTRPTFLHGLTPPLDSTTPDAARAIASKFVARSRVLVSGHQIQLRHEGVAPHTSGMVALHDLGAAGCLSHLDKLIGVDLTRRQCR